MTAVLAAGVFQTKLLAWTVANMLVGGLCAGLAYLRWVLFFARLSTRDAVACLFPAYLVSALFKMLVDFVVPLAGAVLALVLPAVSCVSLRSALSCVHGGFAPGKGEVVYRRGSYGALLRVGLCVLVFFAVRQVVMSVVGAQGDQAVGAVMSHAVEIVLALGVLLWVFPLARSLDFPQLWRFVFLFLATAVFVECAAPGGIWGGLLFEVGTSFAWMLLWLLVRDVAHRCDLHPYVGRVSGGAPTQEATMGIGGRDGFSARCARP